MKEDNSGRRRPTFRTSDKVLLGIVATLVVMIIALSILQRCGLMPVNGAVVLYLPLLTLFVLVGWGGYALIRKIRSRTVRIMAGGGLALLMAVLVVVVIVYVSYIAFFAVPQRYTTVASPSGARRVVVMRALDTDESRMEARRAARLEADPDGDPEIAIEDWGFVYRAYPQVMGLFYRANADVEGEVWLIGSDLVAAADAPDESASEDVGTEEEKASGGTLMVEWLDDGATAHFFVESPGIAEGGDCYVRF